jgi:NADPH:quinone reductase
MRAVRLSAFNTSTRNTDLHLDADTPEPVLGEGELLVDLIYAAVNPLDVWTCQGNFAAVTKLPHIPGAEGIGRTVDGTLGLVNGAGVGIGRPGTYAERIAIPTAAWTPIDGAADPQVAASVAIAGVTAWQCVHQCAQTKPEDTVLVLGATGGVGSIAVQLARSTGATVIGQTSSPDKVDAVRSTGVDEVVVAGDGDALLSAMGDRRASVVIDGLGGTFTAACISVMAPFGRLVNYGTSAGVDVTLQMRNLYRNGITLQGYTGLLLTSEQRAQSVAAVLAGVNAGTLRIAIDGILPLGDAAAAHERILNRSVEGKLLLDVCA